MKISWGFLKPLVLYYSIFILLYLLRYSFPQTVVLCLLALIGAFYLFGIFKKIPAVSQKILSFGGIFCFTSVIFHLVSFTFFLFFGNSFDVWPHKIEVDNAFEYVFEAEFYFITCATLMISGWLLFSGHLSANFALLDLRMVKKSVYKIVLFFLGFMNFVFPIFFANYYSTVGLIGPIINYSYVIIVCLFLFASNSKNTFLNNIFYPILLCLPLITTSINSGMKEVIMFGLIPLFIGIWLLLKTKIQKLIFGVLLFIFFSFVSLYVTATRMIDRETKSNVNITEIQQNLSALVSEPDIILDIVSKVLSRKNMMDMNARAFYFIDQGLVYQEYGFIYGIPVLIPRLFWRSKPKIIPGNEFARLTANDNVLYSDTPGFFTAIYLSSGFAIGLISSFLFGCFIAGLQNAAKLYYTSLGKALFSLNLCYMGLRLDEYFPVEVFPKTISIFLVCGIIGFLLEHFSNAIIVRKPI